MAKELLKEAIADAKAVREVALQNAKMALEEAFDSKIKNMLSAKLAEELEEDVELEEVYDEDESVDEVYDEDDTMEEEFDLEEAKDEDLDEEIDLDELMAELNSLEEGDDEEEMNEGEDEEDLNEDFTTETLAQLAELTNMDMDVLKGILTAAGAATGLGIAALATMLEKLGAKAKDAIQNMAKKFGKNTAAKEVDESFDIDSLVAEIEAELEEGKKGKKEDEELEEAKKKAKKAEDELEEALSTVSSLRESISEMNLLNSKLLYCNKLFRANSLNEAQKVKVIDALDKAATTGEAKLVFETLQESFAFTGVEKKAIKEGLGRASKASGVAPKKVITESVDETVSRFQKLANIKF
jgi:hypothetical protein